MTHSYPVTPRVVGRVADEFAFISYEQIGSTRHVRPTHVTFSSPSLNILVLILIHPWLPPFPCSSNNNSNSNLTCSSNLERPKCQSGVEKSLLCPPIRKRVWAQPDALGRPGSRGRGSPGRVPLDHVAAQFGQKGSKFIQLESF